MSNTSTHMAPLDVFGSAPHTWIRCWDEDVESLRTAALAAGWTWHRVDTAEDLPVLVAALELASSRHQCLMPADRARYLATVGHVLVAVGPGYNASYRYLRWIARSGARTGIHLAVASSHRELAPQDLKDSITGPPNAHVSPPSDDSHAAQSSEHPWIPTPADINEPDDTAPAGLLGAFRRVLGRYRQTDPRSHPQRTHARLPDQTWLGDDPRVQAIVGSAERSGWRIEPHDAHAAVWRFVHDIGTTVTVHWGTPAMPLLHATATATATVRWGATTLPVLVASGRRPSNASTAVDSIVVASDAGAQWIDEQIDQVQYFLHSHPAEYRVMSEISADPRTRSVLAAAEKHGWDVRPSDVDRCTFARNGTEIWLRWGDAEQPFLYAATNCAGASRNLVYEYLDQPPEEQLATMLRFLATEPDNDGRIRNATH